MTCKEKLMREKPDEYRLMFEEKKIRICPNSLGYAKNPTVAEDDACSITCEKCWDREIDIPTPTEPCIKDSGVRRQFDTGAVRDICEGKGRCDLLPLEVVEFMTNKNDGRSITVSKVLDFLSSFQEDGIITSLLAVLELFSCGTSYGEPLSFGDVYTMCLEVAKHFEDGAKKYEENNWKKGIPVHCYIDSAVRHFLKFLRGDKDEPHDRAFVWNIMCCIWTCRNKPELNDYKYKPGANVYKYKSENDISKEGK